MRTRKTIFSLLGFEALKNAAELAAMLGGLKPALHTSRGFNRNDIFPSV
jgi:hypothetical protein